MGESGQRFVRAQLSWPAVAAQMEQAYVRAIRSRVNRT
jgi:hypothetical protein